MTSEASPPCFPCRPCHRPPERGQQPAQLPMNEGMSASLTPLVVARNNFRKLTVSTETSAERMTVRRSAFQIRAIARGRRSAGGDLAGRRRIGRFHRPLGVVAGADQRTRLDVGEPEALGVGAEL